MPSADSGPPRRPGLPHRHSAGSVVAFAKSPHDALSSSMQKQQKPAKHIVGNNRLGSRNPSFGKNLNKLQKLTPARPADPDPTSPNRPSHVKRNSSNMHLDRAPSSSTALRKNHSETSLKKNRSSGQLTKLTRPASSRNVSSKSSKAKHRRSRTSISTIQVPPEGPTNPTVRFALGHDDEPGDDETEEEVSDGDEGSWAYTDSRSPSTTRNSTRRNSLSSQYHAAEGSHEASDQPHSASNSLQPSPNIHRTSTAPAVNSSARAPHIMNRLLKRNVSFTDPTLTSNPATPVMIDPHQPVSQSHNTLNDSSNPEVVSRFLTQSTSTSGPSHTSSFLPRSSTASASQPASPDKISTSSRDPRSRDVDDDAPRRNQSTPNFGAPTGGPSAPVSRTQQRMNLDREAVSNAHPTGPPRALGPHVSRLSAAHIPFLAAGDGSPGPALALHIRQLNDRAGIEYRRVRLYQNPLLEALSRLQAGSPHSQSAKLKPPQTPTTMPSKPDERPPRTPESTKQLSSSWKSARSTLASSATTTAANTAANTPRTTPKRSRVTFQGIKDDEDDDDDARSMRGPGSPASTVGAEDRERDELRELCAKLWVRNDTGLAPAD